MMLRLADVGRNGSFEIFHEDEDQPKRFGNRNRLFNKNGPTESGTIGVWKWRAKPNNSDPSKDFIESEFIPDVNPIEIVSIPDCKTEDDLLEKIKNGSVALQGTIEGKYYHLQSFIMMNEEAYDAWAQFLRA